MERLTGLLLDRITLMCCSCLSWDVVLMMVSSSDGMQGGMVASIQNI